MSINEIITCVEMKLYMFLTVEIFVVEQSVNVYIYLCVFQSLVWMCVNVRFFFLFFFFPVRVF